MHVSKKIISTLLVIFLFTLFYVNITPVNNPDTTRIQDFESYPTNTIDTLILGSSLARMGFNSVEYDAITGHHTFNLGSSAQDLQTSLIVLKDLVLPTQKNIKEIYFFFDPVTINDKYNEDSIHYIYSHVTSHKIKFKMFLSYIKEPQNLFSINSLQLLSEPFRTLISKARDLLLPREKLPDNYKSQYMGKGVLKREPDFSFFNNNYFEPQKKPSNLFSSKNSIINFNTNNKYKYLQKLITFCKTNHIKLHFLRSPVPPLCILTDVDNYFASTQEYNNYFNSQNSAYCDYCDYNLIKKEYAFFEPKDFYHHDHLSYNGATKFSQFLALHKDEIMTIENSNYFYTKKEYIASINWVDSCCFSPINSQNQLHLEFRSLHGSTVKPLYKLIGITGKKPVVLLDYSLQSTFTISHQKLRQLGVKQIRLYSKSDIGRSDQIRSYTWSIK